MSRGADGQRTGSNPRRDSEMYDLGEAVEDGTVPAGTNLLVAGPPLTGKRGLALEMLADGHDCGEGSLVVTTKDGADRILEEYGALVGDLEGAPFGVVDCVTRQQGGGDVVDDQRVRYASSPVDMTASASRCRTFWRSSTASGAASATASCSTRCRRC